MFDPSTIYKTIVVEDAGKFSADGRQLFLLGVLAGWGVPITEEYLCRHKPGLEEYTIIWGSDYQYVGKVSFLFGGRKHG